ncbi:hypothetical protein AVEN_27246-1 [Araneus ventricosus]|uniref:Uncharacterized protein n=1 Tax=Araneus ventricosus TaxID=182803 RepID=A0A4Y2CBG9_ARAVE|nr:hypothetical protein AVEN_27246-1 [Araneus ventricosus]
MIFEVSFQKQDVLLIIESRLKYVSGQVSIFGPPLPHCPASNESHPISAAPVIHSWGNFRLPLSPPLPLVLENRISSISLPTTIRGASNTRMSLLEYCFE